ncbi:Protein kinase domain - like 10 [Theobroma cacao]|nr:Protein kinase domain - like 10 [Theobroma cacao]
MNKKTNSSSSSSTTTKPAGTVLPYQTPRLRDHYLLGKKLGQGQFGTTYQCTHKATGTLYACKSIPKRKLLCREDYDDVWREIQIMHHLSEHPSVVQIKGTYEDSVFVHLVMELCAGGELFDRIVAKGHYSEREAVKLIKTIVGVVEACHSLGVMHRDLKPENFLFDSPADDAILKATDFGLSIFYKPETESGIFRQILHGKIDFASEPWPSISDSAKDLIRKMLERDPRQRISAHEADIDNSGTIDYGEFLAATLHINKMEREENLVAAFSFFDKDGSGYITIDELQNACKEFGLGDVHLDEMIKEIDQDNDGRIDYGEFTAMMRKGDGIGRSRTMRSNLNFTIADAFGVKDPTSDSN